MTTWLLCMTFFLDHLWNFLLEVPVSFSLVKWIQYTAQTSLKPQDTRCINPSIQIQELTFKDKCKHINLYRLQETFKDRKLPNQCQSTNSLKKYPKPKQGTLNNFKNEILKKKKDMILASRPWNKAQKRKKSTFPQH